MAKVKEKELALDLRRRGSSYSQIKKLVGVSKSTLSSWLREYPLSERRVRELRDWNETRIEHYRETRKRKREAELDQIASEERRILLPLSKRDLYVAGLFLYWGEGGKTKAFELTLSNTDPAVLRVFIQWLNEVFGVPKEMLHVKLQLYKDMSISAENKYWSKELGLPITQFRKPYIKSSLLSGLTYRGGFKHGTCNIVFSNAKVSKRVHMGLRVLRQYFGPVA